jgi:phosphoribosyl 1,2-cyclic phosphodiesterase
VLLAAQGCELPDRAAARAFLQSLPFAQRGSYGGQTSCVEITLPRSDHDGYIEHLICDAGSGLRLFGGSALATHGVTTRQRFHILLSHLHWDHIMGLPFFTPAYLPGNEVHFYGGHTQLRAAIERQQDPPSFPVPFSDLRAQLHFHHLLPGSVTEIVGSRVQLLRQNHAGDSYGYRIECGGKAVVYSTDSEHRLDDPEETAAFIRFFDNADAVIFDSMYSLADTLSLKADWGHSSNVVAVELCQLAKARQLLLFHHEPTFSDVRIAQMEAESQRLEAITRGSRAALIVRASYDGMEVAL